MFASMMKSFGMFPTPQEGEQNRVHPTGQRVKHPRDQDSDNLSHASADLSDHRGHISAALGLESKKIAVGNTIDKRRAPTRSFEKTNKRRKLDTLDFPYQPNDDAEEEGDLEGVKTATPAPRSRKQAPESSAATDRALMPPPATGAHPRPRDKATNEDDRISELGSDTPGSSRKKKEDLEDVFDIERQRRHAASVTLPANSGVWVEAEKDMFFHLAYRGCEPLLPTNWMTDFRTLPISLFPNEQNSQPLIRARNLTEFRAIKALRDLVDLGTQIRDRALSSRRPRPESYIENGISQYLLWALSDVQMQPDLRPNAIPVYAVARMKRGQNTQDAIRELATKLHVLGARWRREHDIRESVEVRGMTPVSNEETQLEEDDDNLPILTGIVICSSVIMVLTLNAHTIPPPSLMSNVHQNSQLSSPNSSPESLSRNDDLNADTIEMENQSSSSDVEETGLRVIASFDFSDSGQDVWNALAVAIIAICIRETMLEQYEKAELAGKAGSGTVWEVVDNTQSRRRRGRRNEEDPDA